MPGHRYMEENYLAAMLAAKRSAGVAPEVKAQIRLPTLVLKPTGDLTRSPKQLSVVPQKDVYPKIF